MKNFKMIRFATPAIFLVFIALASSFANIPIANADTIARYMPFANQVVVTVFKGRVSANDTNGKFLFDSMNVPIQSTFLGPGKAINGSGQIMSWVCGDRGTDGHQCTIMIQQSAVSSIGISPVKARYEVTGTEAQTLFQMITANTTAGEFKFTNDEGTLSLDSTNEHFLLSYAE